MKRLRYHNEDAFVLHGATCLKNSEDQLLKDTELFDIWKKLFQSFSPTICVDDSILQKNVRELFEDVVIRFNRVGNAQFRKDFLQKFGREKIARLRKKVVSDTDDSKKTGVKPSTSGCKNPVKSSDDSVPKGSSGETASEVPVKSSRKRPRTRTATVTKKLNESGSKKKESTVCPKCNKVYVDGEKWVACDICDQWFDAACIGLTDEQWQNLDDNDWYCPECLVR